MFSEDVRALGLELIRLKPRSNISLKNKNTISLSSCRSTLESVESKGQAGLDWYSYITKRTVREIARGRHSLPVAWHPEVEQNTISTKSCLKKTRSPQLSLKQYIHNSARPFTPKCTLSCGVRLFCGNPRIIHRAELVLVEESPKKNFFFVLAIYF